MLKRIEHKEEAITGVENSQRYGNNHERVSALVYGALLGDLSSIKPSGHYLEVGAGPGILATMIAEHSAGVRITALDLSPDMVTVARERIKEKRLQDRIRCVIADVNDGAAMQGLGPFDLAYTSFSLHHWKTPETSLENIWKTLKADGLLYVHDLKRVWWLYLLPLNNGFIESIKASYTPKEIRSLLQKLGTKNCQIKTVFPFFMQSVIAWKS